MKNTLFTIATIGTLGVGGFISLSTNAHADTIPNPPKIVALDTTTGNNLNSTKFSIIEKDGNNSNTIGPFSVNDDYSKSIKSIDSVNKDCSDSPETITFKQVGTDNGYKITDGTITLCRASGGWLIDSLHSGSSGSMSFDDSNGVIYINDDKATLDTNTPTSTSSASPTTSNSTNTSSSPTTTKNTSTSTSNNSSNTNTTSPTDDNSSIASSTGSSSSTASSTPSSTSSYDSQPSIRNNTSTNAPVEGTGSVVGPKVVTDFVSGNPLSSIVTIGSLGAGAGILTIMKKKNK